jgi:hypothetical protein
MPAPRVQRIAALLAVMAVAPVLVRFYARNQRLGSMPETISTGVTAHALVRAGTVDVSQYYPAADFPHGRMYAVHSDGERLYSIEPLASALTFAPFFLPYRAMPADGFRMRWRVFLSVASIVTALTVVILAAWMLAIVSVPRALLVTAVIALATSMRTIDAAGLWQHTSAAPWAIAGLALWSLADARPKLYPWAGAALAVATACRPIFVPAALLVAWSALRARRGPGVVTAGVVAAIGGLALLGNWWIHGAVMGGRASVVASISKTHAVAAYFDFSPWNLVGLLVAPSRGLFVYSPVLLFALPGMIATLGASALPAERGITIAGLTMFVLYGFIATWWAGWGYGPRYMTDLLPFFALWLARAPIPGRGRELAALAFVAAFAWSFGAHELGVRAYPCGWDAFPTSVDVAPQRLWSVHDTEIARCWGVLRAAKN